KPSLQNVRFRRESPGNGIWPESRRKTQSRSSRRYGQKRFEMDRSSRPVKVGLTPRSIKVVAVEICLGLRKEIIPESFVFGCARKRDFVAIKRAVGVFVNRVINVDFAPAIAIDAVFPRIAIFATSR